MNVKVHILKLRVQRRPFAHLHILTFAHLPSICTFTKHLHIHQALHIYKTSLTLSASKANCFCKASMLLKRRSSRMRR